MKMLEATKKVKKFITGQSRYCQSCGFESETLLMSTTKNPQVGKLQLCRKCYDKAKDIT